MADINLVDYTHPGPNGFPGAKKIIFLDSTDIGVFSDSNLFKYG